jgi:hypothetical protein
MKESVYSRDFIAQTPPQKERSSRQSISSKVDFAPLNRTSRLSSVARTISSTSLSSKSLSPRKLHRNKSDSTAGSKARNRDSETSFSSPTSKPSPFRSRLHRRRSDSTRTSKENDHSEPRSPMEKRPPTPMKRKPRLSSRRLATSPTMSPVSQSQPIAPMRRDNAQNIANSSTRTKSTTGSTDSAESLTLEDHFRCSPVAPKPVSLLFTLGNLPLAVNDQELSNEDVSKADAVIVRTRRVLKKTGSSRRLS